MDLTASAPEGSTVGVAGPKGAHDDCRAQRWLTPGSPDHCLSLRPLAVCTRCTTPRQAMLMTDTLTPVPPAKPLMAEDRTPAAHSLVHVFILVPFLALVAAVPLAWGWG